MSRIKKYTIGLFLAILMFGTLGLLEYQGFIWHNSILARGYIKGLDISRYQTTIDWDVLKKENDFQFIYIKATEGSDRVDPLFDKHWANAQKYGYAVGAYHFFTTLSPGKTQAENFIQKVPKKPGLLPPVVDVEVNGPDPKVFVQELTDMVNTLENHYGQPPILYVMYPQYKKYIQGNFNDHPIWIRDIVWTPKLPDNKPWLMWQFCNRGRIQGIEGFVDINCFQGSQEELQALLKP